MRTNLHHLLEEKVPEHGGLPALTDKDVTYTYAEVWAKVRGVANGLRGLGLQRDDRVAVFLDKRVETVATIFGTSAAGGVFVPVNPVLRPAQVAYILADCSVRVLVTSPERLDVMKQELKGCPALEHVILVPTAREAAPAPAGRAVLRTPLDRPGECWARRPPDGHRSRHGGDPLHLRQHRKAEGGGAQSPQSDRRRRKRQ